MLLHDEYLLACHFKFLNNMTQFTSLDATKQKGKGWIVNLNDQDSPTLYAQLQLIEHDESNTTFHTHFIFVMA